MSKVIKYTTICINCVDESIQFYTNSLKFKIFDHVKIGNEEEWWVLKKDGNETGLILIKNVNISRNILIINVDDCLLEYSNLKQSDLKQISEPFYFSMGLSITFLDPSGNEIIFLEERKYNEIEI